MHRTPGLDSPACGYCGLVRFPWLLNFSTCFLLTDPTLKFNVDVSPRMATDKTVVGFVSENRQNFVGFCRFFSTDKNRHKKFAKPTNCRFFVGFLSVFCRFGSKIMVFRQIFLKKFSSTNSLYRVKWLTLHLLSGLDTLFSHHDRKITKLRFEKYHF